MQTTMTTTGDAMGARSGAMPRAALPPGATVPVPLPRVSGTHPAPARIAGAGVRPLWDAASGRFDPGRLRGAIVARGWTVPDFAIASTVSRSCVYKALRGHAVGDRTVVRILGTLDSRTPTGLLDE